MRPGPEYWPSTGRTPGHSPACRLGLLHDLRRSLQRSKECALTPTDHTRPSVTGAKSSDLAAEIVHDAQRLVTLEIALAKQEIKDLAVANAIAAGMVVVGGVLVMLAVLVAIPTLIVVLVPWHWQAAAVWVIAYALAGLVLALVGRTRFGVRLPARTVQSLKESKEWVLRQTKLTVR